MSAPGDATVIRDPRYHSLDGVRASMMLLGIVFHATWFFIPVYFWSTITDASAHWGFFFFFYWVHIFRMQAFFLIAGFFACLLLNKRGPWKFVHNRIFRVALPFVVSMIVLYPIMRYQMIVGGLESGRIQSDLTPLQLLGAELAAQNWWHVWPKHLWFLYTLLVLYAIALPLYWLFARLVDRRGKLRAMIQAGMARVLSSPAAFLLLSLPVGLLLFLAETWFGIFAGAMQPHWLGVFGYWIFFAVGWCLYRQPELLQRVGRGWKTQFAAGTVLSLILCVAFLRISSAAPGPLYPVMLDGDIKDYPALRQHLLQPANPVAQAVWDHLTPEYQRFFTEVEQPSSDQLNGVAKELSRAGLANPGLSTPASIAGLALGEQTRRLLEMPAAKRKVSGMLLLNRQVMEVALEPAIARPWSGPFRVKAAYFGGYALASWLCVFGILGFFQRFLRQPSPSFRYFADASYWLYLIHLPVQFVIQLNIASLVWPWPVKLAVYLLVSFAVLVPSYHYLVRSTWIGQFLTGKRYERAPLLGSSSALRQPSLERQ